MALPGEPPIRDARPCQAQLREGRKHQPTPAVGLLRMAHPRGSPPQSLFEEAEGMLQVEAPNVRPPEEIEVRLSGAGPPQPRHARLVGRALQASDLPPEPACPEQWGGDFFNGLTPSIDNTVNKGER
jgi:hypothetical protein